MDLYTLLDLFRAQTGQFNRHVVTNAGSKTMPAVRSPWISRPTGTCAGSCGHYTLPRYGAS